MRPAVLAKLLRRTPTLLALAAPYAVQHDNVAQPTETRGALQDISGFSRLNERFAKEGGEGFGKMMSLINMYFQQVRDTPNTCNTAVAMCR